MQTWAIGVAVSALLLIAGVCWWLLSLNPTALVAGGVLAAVILVVTALISRSAWNGRRG